MDAGFHAASAALEEEVRLSTSVPSSDPHLVLVLVALEVSVDLTVVARRLGLDVLLDADGEEPADEDYSSVGDDVVFPSSLYAVAVDRAALDGLLLAWRRWRRGEAPALGTTPLRDLFTQLKDVRPWGPADRLQLAPWRVAMAGALPGVKHPIEVELWFSSDPRRRAAARDLVTARLEAEGGRVLGSADVPAIGYHALACEVPASVVLALAAGDYEESLVVRSSDVMYFRATGQHLLDDRASEGLPATGATHPLPQGSPVVCVLDGVPVANHNMLTGRVVVHDPDDHASDAPLADRRHGTAMASVAVWGDLGAHEAPATRPLLVRPVLVPSSATLDRVEEFPAHELVPDLMERVFRELFEPGGEASEVAHSVTVVSLSVGDPAAPFATLMSAWARALDHLSERYGVLVIVSAGNHGVLDLGAVEARSLEALPVEARRATVLDAVERLRLTRTLLSPAEAVNAVTVGALHEDASGPLPGGYLIDPLGSSPTASPVSGLGTGLRRSVKPEVAAPGGRVTFAVPYDGRTTLALEGRSVEPGIRVASSSDSAGLTHTVGTSPAAALVARRAGRLVESVEGLFPRGLSRHERAVAAKALLVHGAQQPLGSDLSRSMLEAALGHGGIVRDLADGCAPHEATMLFLGALHAGQSQRLVLPIPDGLALRGRKRVTATLAWLTPVNWRHRQYRRAKLEFAKPSIGGAQLFDAATGVAPGTSKRGATTLQHGIWETDKSVAAGAGDGLSIDVICTEQAGGLAGDGVFYAVALSLWVAPELGVNVYEQVAQQVRSQSTIRPPVR